MKREENPGIAWIRDVRHKISAEFEHDPKKMGDHFRELEKNTPTVSCETSNRSRMRSRRQNNRGMMLTTQAILLPSCRRRVAAVSDDGVVGATSRATNQTAA